MFWNFKVSFRLASSGRLDADEHPSEVRGAEEPQELFVVRQVQRHFGAELEPVVVVLLIASEELEQLLRARLVADEVVVDEQEASRPRDAQPIELEADLLEGLGARLSAEHDDDVAELAAKRASA